MLGIAGFTTGIVLGVFFLGIFARAGRRTGGVGRAGDGSRLHEHHLFPDRPRVALVCPVRFGDHLCGRIRCELHLAKNCIGPFGRRETMQRPVLTLLLIVALASPLCIGAAPDTTASELVAPGLRHFVLERGRATTETTYRFQLGTFERQSEADAVLNDLRANSIAAELEATGTSYRSTARPCPPAKWRRK